MFGRSKTGGVPDLPRADLAEAQMRRQRRGAVAVGPVAFARVALCVSQKLLQPFLRGLLARRPGLAQTARPIGMMRLKLEAFERVATNARRAAQRFWRGQRLGWIARGQHPAPERREHPQAAALLVADFAGCDQQVAREAFGIYAKPCERRRNRFGDGQMRGLLNLAPEYRACLRLLCEFGDDFGCRSPPQHQRGTPGLQVGLQRPQRLRQPPARRATEWPHALAHFVEDIEAAHRSAGLRRRVQGRVIGQAQIVAKPDDDGCGGLGHEWAQRRRPPAGSARLLRRFFSGSATLSSGSPPVKRPS